ncbi:hypothetical protein PAXRUDRAFT_19752 [Paxillus rubicundulus Ve08.2h10]|uniref:Uncharacterized protein n=1 Tax=Paxillus rubicundulus Ve08.2h10 TaxID=930991 RepID=A0A0D0BT12_9AGAM|nr:hypothetical protein PAXRUDRAFT_19752 [Paxillus rubicundulus Ve08.2h10]
MEGMEKLKVMHGASMDGEDEDGGVSEELDQDHNGEPDVVPSKKQCTQKMTMCDTVHAARSTVNQFADHKDLHASAIQKGKLATA